MKLYSISDLKRLVKNPKLGLRELNRLYYTRLRSVSGNPDGSNILEEDWDVCLLLDACRYDVFQSVALPTLQGSLEKRTSRASSTIEWINTCIRGRTYHDTVYVTANPKFSRTTVSESVFFDIVYTWEEVGGSSSGTEAFDPEIVTEHILRAADAYPKKRILGHFMQPHVPFIGPEGREMFAGDPYDRTSITPEHSHLKHREAYRLAYADNLKYVLGFVEKVLSDLDDRVVVTADHGELMGERCWPIPIREFGHPAGIYMPELVEIPWFVREGESRRTIVTEVPIEEAERVDADDHDVDELLSQLGYR